MFQRPLMAAAATFLLCAGSALAESNGRQGTPDRLVGTYTLQGQTDTVSGPFGTFTCTEFQQFSPELVCANASILELRADGTTGTTIAGQSPISDVFGNWRRSGPRQVSIESIAIVYDANGVAENWALTSSTVSFDRRRTAITTSFEINWFPITDDPRNPTSPPVITFIGGSEGAKFD